MAGPDNLMLLLHTVRAILRDARMHEAAGLIQTQVDLMMKDVHRLEERVAKLATHFSQTERDISDIQTSTRKIISRGDKIMKLSSRSRSVLNPKNKSLTCLVKFLFIFDNFVKSFLSWS